MSYCTVHFHCDCLCRQNCAVQWCNFLSLQAVAGALIFSSMLDILDNESCSLITAAKHPISQFSSRTQICLLICAAAIWIQFIIYIQYLCERVRAKYKHNIILFKFINMACHTQIEAKNKNKPDMIPGGTQCEQATRWSFLHNKQSSLSASLHPILPQHIPIFSFSGFWTFKLFRNSHHSQSHKCCFLLISEAGSRSSELCNFWPLCN